MCTLTHILSSLFITLPVDTERQDSCQVDVMRKELEEIDRNKVCTWNNINEGRTLPPPVFCNTPSSEHKAELCEEATSVHQSLPIPCSVQ